VIADASWSALPGIDAPFVHRIELSSGTRAVLTLDANGLRVLGRLGYARRAAFLLSAITSSGRGASLPSRGARAEAASQMLRRHGQIICRRSNSPCLARAIAADCPSAGQAPTLY
jgi:endonuclease III